MRTKRSITFIILSFFFVIGMSGGMTGCSSSPKSVEESRTESTDESYGPPTPAIPPSYGPAPIHAKPVVLVLGPGMAKGFAYVGVLSVLKQNKIPIGAIFGTEMGALVGALYASSSSFNQFEWALQKFKEEVFVNSSGFFSKNSGVPNSGERLEEMMSQVFGSKNLNEGNIPLRLVMQSKDTGIPMIALQGNMTKAVRCALATPSFFTPGTWQDDKGRSFFAVSANSTRPFPVHEAQLLGMGPVIVVNVLTDVESSIATGELKSADIHLQPDMNGIDYRDFKKKNEAIFRGRAAMQKIIPEVRQLVGLPELDSKKRSAGL